MTTFRDARRVLVPLDFSDAGKPVLPYALEVARLLKARVRLVHVVGLPYAAFDSAYGVTTDARLLLDIQAAARARLKEIAAGIGDLEVETNVVVGSPAREVVREAREWKADLVVIGTHGRTGLRHVFLGSVAENVVRLSPCPVLTVKPDGFAIEAV